MYRIGKGFLADKTDEHTKFGEGDTRDMLPRYTEEARIANKALPHLPHRFGEKEMLLPAQIALGCVLAQKPWIVPIPATTKMHRLKENNGAFFIQLTSEELQETAQASVHVKIMYNRYTEAMAKSTGL